MSNKKKIRAQVPPSQRTRSKGKVVTAVLHGLTTGFPRFWNSYIDLLLWDQVLGGSQHISGRIDETAGANIVTPRNKVVREFLDEKKDAEWLLMLDDDMTFQPDLLERLMDTADKDERPIVGGLCFSLMKGEDQEIAPTLYGVTDQGTVRFFDYPPDQVVKVAATGAACLLVHRRVFEGILERNRPPWPWFQELVTGDQWGDSMSEDLTFCLRAQQAGFPVHVDTAVKVGHVKPVVVDEAMFRANQPKPVEEPPAPTYVVIPVKGQHHYTDALLDQLEEQGGYEAIFVLDNAYGTDDYYPERQTRGCEVIAADGDNIYQMWNEGIRAAIELHPRCNIAILNNDIEIGENFLARLAKGLRAHPTIAAVCGNYDGREMPELVQQVKGVAAGRMDGTGGFAGFAFMVRGEIFAAGCPMFDEQYEIWYGDTDFTKVLDAGDAVYGIVRDAHVVHIDGGSKTSGDGKGKRLTPELAEAAERDRKRFEEKWARVGAA